MYNRNPYEGGKPNKSRIKKKFYRFIQLCSFFSFKLLQLNDCTEMCFLRKNLASSFFVSNIILSPFKVIECFNRFIIPSTLNHVVFHSNTKKEMEFVNLKHKF